MESKFGSVSNLSEQKPLPLQKMHFEHSALRPTAEPHKLGAVAKASIAAAALTGATLGTAMYGDEVSQSFQDGVSRAHQGLKSVVESLSTPPEYGKTRPDGYAEVDGKKVGDLLFAVGIVPAGLNGEIPPAIREEPNQGADEISRAELEAYMKKASEGMRPTEMAMKNLTSLSDLRGKRIWGGSYAGNNGSVETERGGMKGKWHEFTIGDRNFYVSDNFVADKPDIAPMLELVVQH